MVGMKNMKRWMLGAAIAACTLGLAAAPAQAARIGIGISVGGPAAYVPPCPGPGYVWVPGCWANGYWVAGYWNFGGVRRVAPIVRFHGPVYGRHFDRHYDRGPFRR
jgi:hypothetical protein